MPYKTGDTVYVSFTVSDIDGLVNADSLPTGVVRKNGAALGTTVTVTNNSTGDYTASFVLATALITDTFELVATVIVGGITNKLIEKVAIDSFLTDSAEPAQGAPAATASPKAKLDNLHMAWRNKKTASDTLGRIYADDGTTVAQKWAITEEVEQTTIGEIAAGP